MDDLCEICGTDESLAKVRFERDLPTMYAGPVDAVRVLCRTCRGVYRGNEDAEDAVVEIEGEDGRGWRLTHRYRHAVKEGRLDDYVEMLRWSFTNLEVKLWGKPSYPFITYHADEGSGTVVSDSAAKFDDAIRRELGLEYDESESWLAETRVSVEREAEDEPKSGDEK